jgi:hypothetical protein
MKAIVPVGASTGDLAVLVAVQAARLERLGPAVVRRLQQIVGHARRGDRERRVAVHLDHVEERLAVHPVARERTHRLGDRGARGVGLPHITAVIAADEIAPFVAVVGQAERHQERAEVRVAESERAEQMAVARDRGRRIRRVIDQDLLGEDRERGRAAELLDVEPPSASTNFIRLRLARLHAVSSRNMYSEHGLLELIRPDALTGFQRLIVVSYWMPGSPHTCAASAISRSISRASSVSNVSPVVTARVCHFAPFCAACMKPSVTRTEWFAFWKNTES